jgi:hypothetical protein
MAKVPYVTGGIKKNLNHIKIKKEVVSIACVKLAMG